MQITPAYNGRARTGNVDGGAWDAMATGLETGGVDAFVEVAQPAGAGEGWKRIAREAVRQRMERHEHPLEVAKALRSMPRSTAWDGLEALRDVEVPVLIVASRDEMDHLHPLAIAEEYARLLPNAELVVEEEGKSPLAWQGARLSNVIADFFERVGLRALVEHAAQPHDRRALLGRHRVVLRGAHRQALQAVLGASSARRAKWRRLRSGSSVKGGIVIRPVTGQGQRSM